MDNRGTHLGDGAYIVPDPAGHPNQVWFAANDHRNPVVAVDGYAIQAALNWLAEHRPLMFLTAVERVPYQTEIASSHVKAGMNKVFGEES